MGKKEWVGPQEPVDPVEGRGPLGLEAAEAPQVYPETGAMTGPRGLTESPAPPDSQETKELLGIQVHQVPEEIRAKTGSQAPPERRASWEVQDLDLEDQKDPKEFLAVGETRGPRAPVAPRGPLDSRESMVL